MALALSSCCVDNGMGEENDIGGNTVGSYALGGGAQTMNREQS